MRVALFAILFIASALAQIVCVGGGCPPAFTVPTAPVPPPPPAFVRRWCDMRGDWRANTDTVVRRCRRNAQNMYFCSQVGTGAVWRDAEVAKAFVNSTNLYHADYKQPVPGQPYYKWYKMMFLFPTGAATTSLTCVAIQLKNFQTGAVEQRWDRVLPVGSTVHAPVAQACESLILAHTESDWKNAALSAHNYWRCLFPGAGLVRVTWNQAIADQLANNGKVNVCGGMQHTAPQYLAATATMPGQGENLAWMPNMDPTGVPLYNPATPTTARWSTLIRMAVDLWAEERVNWVGPYFDRETSCRSPKIDAAGKTCNSAVGHFTQVVWNNPPPTHPTYLTKSIGCVIKYCPPAAGQPLHWAMFQIGCRYLGAGNWGGGTFKPYEEAETALHSTYLGLNLSSLPHSSLLVAAMGVALVTIMAAVVVVVRRRRTAPAALDEELLAVDETL